MVTVVCGADDCDSDYCKEHAMPSKPLGTIWVCTDCFMVDANGELPDPEPETSMDYETEPWSAIDHPSTVTMGMLASEHEDDCPAFEDGEFTGNECMGCETQDFSWSRCDGCGSNLGGQRHAYTLWED